MDVTKREAALAARRQLRRRGFDACTWSGGHWKVGCSQCQALTINGLACHETGCPRGRAARRKSRPAS